MQQQPGYSIPFEVESSTPWPLTPHSLARPPGSTDPHAVEVPDTNIPYSSQRPIRAPVAPIARSQWPASDPVMPYRSTLDVSTSDTDRSPRSFTGAKHTGGFSSNYLVVSGLPTQSHTLVHDPQQQSQQRRSIPDGVLNTESCHTGDRVQPPPLSATTHDTRNSATSAHPSSRRSQTTSENASERIWPRAQHNIDSSYPHVDPVVASSSRQSDFTMTSALPPSRKPAPPSSYRRTAHVRPTAVASGTPRQSASSSWARSKSSGGESSDDQFTRSRSDSRFVSSDAEDGARERRSSRSSTIQRDSTGVNAKSVRSSADSAAQRSVHVRETTAEQIQGPLGDERRRHSSSHRRRSGSHRRHSGSDDVTEQTQQPPRGGSRRRSSPHGSGVRHDSHTSTYAAQRPSETSSWRRRPSTRVSDDSEDERRRLRRRQRREERRRANEDYDSRRTRRTGF